MLPLRDRLPTRTIPVVNYLLIAANVIAFIWERALVAVGNPAELVVRHYGLIPFELVHAPGREAWTVFSSMFLHDPTGWAHIGGNMLFLWIFGDNLEEEMGHFGFLLFYLFAGAAAGMAQALPDPGSPVPMVGASGAVAGVMGGYLLLFPRARVDVLFIFIIFFRIFAIPAWIVLGLWLAIQVFSGVATPGDLGGVAHWAHVGGFGAGLVLTLPVWLRRGASGYWHRTEGRPPHPDTEFAASRSNIPLIRRRR